jgi:hypothetical protein
MFIGAIGCEPLQLARVGLENSHTLEVYRKNGGYEALKKVLDGMFLRIRLSPNTLSATRTNPSLELSKTAI